VLLSNAWLGTAAVLHYK